MAIIKAKWEDNNNKYEIHMGGFISQAILTVEDVSDGVLQECLRYTLKKKMAAHYKVNGESSPYDAVDIVLDIDYNFKDILKSVDDIIKSGGYYNGGSNIEVFKGKSEEGKCKYLIRMNSALMYELVGYDYD